MIGFRWRLLACVAAVLHLALAGPAPNAAAEQTGELRIAFADAARGREILTTEDAFLARLSPFDRQSRVQSTDPVSTAEYRDFVADHVRRWQPDQQRRVRAAFARIEPQLRRWLPRDFPAVEIVLTSGREESGAAYTRGVAIVLPTARIEDSEEGLARLLAHEFFHVLSRRFPELRDELYETIGFRRTVEIELPERLRPLRLTNPDAPVIEHVLDLQLATGEKSIVAPVLFAKQPYDPAKMTRMFAYLQFQLMEVRRDDAGQMRPVLVDGDVQFHPPSHPDYTRQIGRNTRYIIHPEEVLADNFADLIVGRSDAPDPWVVDRMRRVLQAFRNR